MWRLFLTAAAWLWPTGNINTCVAYWQRELGLTDWTIITGTVPNQSLGGRILGDIDINNRSKIAVVRLMRVQDSDLPRRLARAEQRFTIAHELVHLRLYVNGNPHWQEEAAVDAATISLMRKNGRWSELLALERE